MTKQIYCISDLERIQKLVEKKALKPVDKFLIGFFVSSFLFFTIRLIMGV